MQCFTSPPTQYRLYGRLFSRVKRPNQQYQSTEGKSTKEKSENANNKIHICIHENRQKRYKYTSQQVPYSLHYTNMGWLGDGSHRGQVRQAWTAVLLPPQHHTSWSNFPYHGARLCIRAVFAVDSWLSVYLAPVLHQNGLTYRRKSFTTW